MQCRDFAPPLRWITRSYQPHLQSSIFLILATKYKFGTMQIWRTPSSCRISFSGKDSARAAARIATVLPDSLMNERAAVYAKFENASSLVRDGACHHDLLSDRIATAIARKGINSNSECLTSEVMPGVVAIAPGPWENKKISLPFPLDRGLGTRRKLHARAFRLRWLLGKNCR